MRAAMVSSLAGAELGDADPTRKPSTAPSTASMGDAVDASQGRYTEDQEERCEFDTLIREDRRVRPRELISLVIEYAQLNHEPPVERYYGRPRYLKASRHGRTRASKKIHRSKVPPPQEKMFVYDDDVAKILYPNIFDRLRRKGEEKVEEKMDIDECGREDSRDSGCPVSPNGDKSVPRGNRDSAEKENRKRRSPGSAPLADETTPAVRQCFRVSGRTPLSIIRRHLEGRNLMKEDRRLELLDQSAKECLDESLTVADIANGRQWTRNRPLRLLYSITRINASEEPPVLDAEEMPSLSAAPEGAIVFPGADAASSSSSPDAFAEPRAPPTADSERRDESLLKLSAPAPPHMQAAYADMMAHMYQLPPHHPHHGLFFNQHIISPNMSVESVANLMANPVTKKKRTRTYQKRQRPLIDKMMANGQSTTATSQPAPANGQPPSTTSTPSTQSVSSPQPVNGQSSATSPPPPSATVHPQHQIQSQPLSVPLPLTNGTSIRLPPGYHPGMLSSVSHPIHFLLTTPDGKTVQMTAGKDGARLLPQTSNIVSGPPSAPNGKRITPERKPVQTSTRNIDRTIDKVLAMKGMAARSSPSSVTMPPVALQASSASPPVGQEASSIGANGESGAALATSSSTTDAASCSSEHSLRIDEDAMEDMPKLGVES